jgi:multimeric flavodoxin WrbA
MLVAITPSSLPPWSADAASVTLWLAVGFMDRLGGMKALVLNCTLKSSPTPSNTQVLADVVIHALEAKGVEVQTVRVVDHHIPPGVQTDLGPGDEWPSIHEALMASDILIIATPTWLGQPSSISKLVLERMDAMISETKDDGTYAAYNKVAGVVVTGNEDGAHHVITEVAGALVDIGFTIPGQAWTYWNMGPGPGPSYTETDHKHDWSEKTGRTMAANLHAAATALAAHPLPPAG